MVNQDDPAGKVEKHTQIERFISTVLLTLCPKFRLYHFWMTTMLSKREDQYQFTDFL